MYKKYKWVGGVKPTTKVFRGFKVEAGNNFDDKFYISESNDKKESLKHVYEPSI